MAFIGLASLGRCTGVLRPAVPTLAWRALGSKPFTAPVDSHHRGLHVLAFKADAAVDAKKHTSSANTPAQFSSAAAALLKPPIAYSELTVGAQFFILFLSIQIPCNEHQQYLSKIIHLLNVHTYRCS